MITFFGNLRLRLFKLLRGQLQTTWNVSILDKKKNRDPSMFKVFINNYF